MTKMRLVHYLMSGKGLDGQSPIIKGDEEKMALWMFRFLNY